jgi:hypothetical protein
LIVLNVRLLLFGLLAALLLSQTGRRAADGAAAATAAPPQSKVRQKYVIQNIVSNDNSNGNLKRLKAQFLDEVENQFSELDVEIENRDWLDTEKCKAGQHCDLVTIDVDKRQLLIRCTERRGILPLPVPPAPCPNGKDRCMLPLSKQLPQKLWSHDEIHRNKNR